MSISPVNAGDESVGTLTKPFALVSSLSFKRNGVEVALTNQALDTFGAPTDNTSLDASLSAHGLMPKASFAKLDGIDVGQILGGDMTAAVYDPTNIAGDCFALGSMTGELATSQVANGAITHAKQVDIATSTFIGRLSGGTGSREVLTAAQVRGILNVETGADATDSTNVGSALAGVAEKDPPVDADTIPLTDSADSNALKKVTWANIKATLKTYFDTLYNLYVHPDHTGDVTSTADGATVIDPTAITGKATVTGVSGDLILISDTSDSGNLKTVDLDDLLSVSYTHPNHTGDVTSTGDGATVIDPTAITGKAAVTGASGDLVLISDASDGGALKAVDLSELIGGGGGGGSASSAFLLMGA